MLNCSLNEILGGGRSVRFYYVYFFFVDFRIPFKKMLYNNKTKCSKQK